MVARLDPENLEQEALDAAAEASSLGALADVRIRFLGRNSALKLALRQVRDRDTGMKLNAVKDTVESVLDAREAELARADLEERLATERVDITLPAQLLGPPKLRPRGTLHPSTLVRRDVEDIFLGLGYEIVDGREVETTRYNFDALGFPDWHPTRSPRASLFLDEQTLLRTETSPAQIHKMEERRPPIYLISSGRFSTSCASCTALSARCASVRTTSRSPSRRWSPTSHASTAAARAARSASTRAGSSWAARGWSIRTCTSSSAGARRSTRASPSGWASSAPPSSATGSRGSG